jgi:hypothetical protein
MQGDTSMTKLKMACVCLYWATFLNSFRLFTIGHEWLINIVFTRFSKVIFFLQISDKVEWSPDNFVWRKWPAELGVITQLWWTLSAGGDPSSCVQQFNCLLSLSVSEYFPAPWLTRKMVGDQKLHYLWIVVQNVQVVCCFDSLYLKTNIGGRLI